MSEELLKYQKKRRGVTIYEGNKLGNYEYYVLGDTTLLQLQKAKIIKGFTTDIIFKPRFWSGKPSSLSKPDEMLDQK